MCTIVVQPNIARGRGGGEHLSITTYGVYAQKVATIPGYCQPPVPTTKPYKMAAIDLVNNSCTLLMRLSKHCRGLSRKCVAHMMSGQTSRWLLTTMAHAWGNNKFTWHPCPTITSCTPKCHKSLKACTKKLYVA